MQWHSLTYDSVPLCKYCQVYKLSTQLNKIELSTHLHSGTKSSDWNICVVSFPFSFVIYSLIWFTFFVYTFFWPNPSDWLTFCHRIAFIIIINSIKAHVFSRPMILTSLLLEKRQSFTCIFSGGWICITPQFPVVFLTTYPGTDRSSLYAASWPFQWAHFYMWNWVVKVTFV
jgi:hypothetical protein